MKTLKILTFIVIIFLLIPVVSLPSEEQQNSPEVNFYFSPDNYDFKTKGKLIIEYKNLPGGLAGSRVTLMEEWAPSWIKPDLNIPRQSNEISQSEMAGCTEENGRLEVEHRMSVRFDSFITKLYPGGMYIIYTLHIDSQPNKIVKSFKVHYK